MTRVDFYVLPVDDDVGPVATVCRLCDKAASAGQRIYIHAEDGALLDDIDSTLWSFRQNSFLSHERLDADGNCSPLAMVILGTTPPPDSHRDVLINLGTEVPRFFSSFERVLEPVFGDTEARAQARTRFAFYRDRGYTLDTHKL